MAKEGKAAVPKEAQVMAAILKDMAITDFEPGVINHMLEFTYRYVSQVLDDARVFANYAKKARTIELDDIKLAVHMQMEKSFTAPPPRDLLLELARSRNSNPLPAIKPNQYGIRLPPDRYCLSACNYRIKPPRKKASNLGGGASRINLGGGMKLGGGGALKPTISMVTTKTGNTQTVTLVQKPATSITSGPAQKIVSVNRPVFKVTPAPTGNSGVMMNVTTANIKADPDAPTMKRKRDDQDDTH